MCPTTSAQSRDREAADPSPVVTGSLPTTERLGSIPSSSRPGARRPQRRRTLDPASPKVAPAIQYVSRRVPATFGCIHGGHSGKKSKTSDETKHRFKAQYHLEVFHAYPCGTPGIVPCRGCSGGARPRFRVECTPKAGFRSG